MFFRFAIAALAAGVATAARAQLFGIDYDTGRVFSIDPNNAALTLVANTGITSVGDLVLGEDGNVYGFTTGSSSQLYKFNPKTWAATKVGPLGNGFYFEGALAINDDGDVYGAGYGNAVNAQLFTLDLSTGAATTGPALANGPHDFNGFAFRDDGDLVGIDGYNDTLDQIDTTSGAVNQIGAINTTLGEVGGLTELKGTAYFATGGPAGAFPGTNGLYSLNLYSGESDLVGDFNATLINGTGISGLVAVPTPEPLSLMGLASLAGLALRRSGKARRKQ